MDETPLTLAVLIHHYTQALAQQGKSKRTVVAYTHDCSQILAYFGEHKQIQKLLPAHVAGFYTSKALLRVAASGKTRAPVSIQRTKRVLRLLLVWAQAQGHLNTLPIPQKDRPKHKPYNKS